MPPKDGGRMDLQGRGKGRGKGGRKGGAAGGKGTEAASRLSQMDDRSVEAESNIEILRAQRARMRRGSTDFRDAVRENEGIDMEDPSIVLDGGIRIEPFNMRREMAEGKFDEGGFYVLNKEEEKEVTDAWLDTVDQAERTATFKREGKLGKAAQTTGERLAAISKHLKEGGDDGEEEEKDEEEDNKEPKGEGDEAASQKKEDASAPKPEEPPEEEDPADEISMLEGMVSELLPLETVTAALARLARGDKRSREGGASKEPPLKLRARMRQAKAAASEQKPGQGRPVAQPVVMKPKKRKFNEFGYDDTGAEAATPSTAAVAPEAVAPANPNAKEEAAQEEAADKLGSASTVTNPSQVAAAAEKAAAKDKADAESAAAFAAEMRLTKQVLHAGIDEMGPEAAAMMNLNADEGGTAKIAVSGLEQKEVAPDIGPGSKKKTAADAPELERKKKIERLTDLCDALLQKGVNVYDSTREQLAIEVRERKGEMLREEASKDAEEPEGTKVDGAAPSPASEKEKGSKAGTQSGDAAPSKPTEVLYENKRFVAVDGAAAVVDAEKFDAGAGTTDQALFWQFRWVATPDALHGPFDSITMQGWMTQGCFAEERPAEVRQCDARNEPVEKCWHHWQKIDFALYL